MAIANDKRISEAVIRRLPKYFRQLRDLKSRGVTRISSGDLAKEMGLNASQIRQDLNCFGGFGQQGYGYQVEVLISEIGAILGLGSEYKTIIVGAGNIGSALAGYGGFKQFGFSILAAFDTDAAKVGQKIGEVPILALEEVQGFIKENGVTIAVVAVPKAVAQQLCDSLAEAGVRAIWNFAPVDVVSDKAKVENVHLNDSLFVLSYRLAHD